MPQQKAEEHTAREFRYGEIVTGGEAFSHKCSIITGIKIWNPNFHKGFATLDHSCSSRQQSCSSISLEDGGTRNPQLLTIWSYLLSHQITITAEYLPSRLNVRADWKSRNATDSSYLKLYQKVFLKITKLCRNPNSSSVCLQAVSTISPIYGMEARTSFSTDAMQQNWKKMFAVAFPLRMSIQRPLLLTALPNSNSNTKSPGRKTPKLWKPGP